MSSSSVQERKAAVVSELQTKLKNANALFLTDFTGLSVKNMTRLRHRLREAGVEYVVVKNTLARRAIEETHQPSRRMQMGGLQASHPYLLM
jgi:large subunit ribosomal protein L10